MPPRVALHADPSAMTEAALQEHVLYLARFYGWLPYHTHDSRRSQPGFPDLVLASELLGLLVFAELKTEKGRQTAEQKEWERVLTLVATAGTGIAYHLWRPRHLHDGTITRTLQGRRPA